MSQTVLCSACGTEPNPFTGRCPSCGEEKHSVLIPIRDYDALVAERDALREACLIVKDHLCSCPECEDMVDAALALGKEPDDAKS